nr:Icc-like protein [Desulfobacula sp.]
MKALSRLKILSLSDFIDPSLTRQVEEKTLEPVDLILSCGDLPPEYLSFLRDRLDRPLFYVKGNHDIRYTDHNPVGCTHIHGRIMVFNSVKILGLDGSMWYNGGENQYREAEMKKIIQDLWFSIWRKGGVDILVTHAPPRHVHDAEDLCHRGFESFNQLIHKKKPGFLIHGHMHKPFKAHEDRITRVGRTKVINTCGYTIFEAAHEKFF